MESLNVSGMMKNKHLSKVIQQQKIYEFKRQIEYNSKLNGIEFIQVDKFYPSSKTCSCCGNIKKDLKLSDRMYKCDVCGLVIDRDYNASINLANFAFKNWIKGEKENEIIISVSDAYGSDCSISVDITECEKNAVVFETDKSWTGYDQDGEDANQDIRCTICGKNPFQNDEIQIFNIVRVVKFKKAK